MELPENWAGIYRVASSVSHPYWGGLCGDVLKAPTLL